MRTLVTILVIAGVVTGECIIIAASCAIFTKKNTHDESNLSHCHQANNLRGDDKSRELQTVIDATSSRGGRSRSTNRGQNLYIVEEDSSRRTIDCADETAEVFEDDFRKIYIVDDDDDARDGDVVAVIDKSTNCERLWSVLLCMLSSASFDKIISLQIIGYIGMILKKS